MKQLICLKDLLLLLEGEPVKLPSPKNQFEIDVSIKTDITFFATRKGKIIGKHERQLRDRNDGCLVESI